VTENVEAPGHWHGDAQWKLVRRREVDQARSSKVLMPWRSANGIDRHRDKFRSGSNENLMSDLVARILNEHGIARVYQQPSNQIESFLNAGHDQDLIGAAMDTSRNPKVLRNRDPQWLVALGLTVQELLTRDKL